MAVEHNFIKMGGFGLTWCQHCGTIAEQGMVNGEYITVYRRPGQQPTEGEESACIPVRLSLEAYVAGLRDNAGKNIDREFQVTALQRLLDGTD